MSRRPHRSLALLLAVPFALVGCGASGAGETGTAAAPQTRTVETLNGGIAIPAEPQRVATLSWVYPEPLVDLGVTPVAMPEGSDDATLTPQRYVDALATVPCRLVERPGLRGAAGPGPRRHRRRLHYAPGECPLSAATCPLSEDS